MALEDSFRLGGDEGDLAITYCGSKIATTIPSLPTHSMSQRDPNGTCPSDQSRKSDAAEQNRLNLLILDAAADGRADEVRRLLEAGADPDARPDGADTALLLAATCGYAECVELLLPVSDAACSNDEGNTPLMQAVLNWHADCAKLLLPASDPNARNKHRHTALMMCASGGRNDCLRALLPVSDATASDPDGWTPLMIAAAHGNEEAVKLLLPRSDLSQTNRHAHNAQQAALRHGHARIAELIQGAALALHERAEIGAASAEPDACAGNAKRNAKPKQLKI